MPKPEDITFEELRKRVTRWTACVQGIAEGQSRYVYYDEYLNDMDTRRNTGNALELHRASADPNIIAQLEKELKEADAALLTCTEETVSCIWRDEVAERRGWCREVEWFYYRRPKIRLEGDSDLWPAAREQRS